MYCVVIIIVFLVCGWGEFYGVSFEWWVWDCVGYGDIGMIRRYVLMFW